jgi:hypothetical protein
LLAATTEEMQQDGELADEDDEPDEFPEPPCPPPRRPPNQPGMEGNHNGPNPNPQHVHHDDPFAKVKFSIPPFY